MTENSRKRGEGPRPKPGTEGLRGHVAEVSAEEWESIREDIGLSPREFEIALHILRGSGEKKIAAVLGISPHTVHSHLRRIYKKLGVRRRSQLVVRLFQAHSDLDDS